MTDPTAMSTVVSALTSVLNTDTMFTNLGTLIPVLSGLLAFAFVYRIIRKMVKGAPKGKVNF